MGSTHSQVVPASMDEAIAMSSVREKPTPIRTLGLVAWALGRLYTPDTPDVLVSDSPPENLNVNIRESINNSNRKRSRSGLPDRGSLLEVAEVREKPMIFAQLMLSDDRARSHLKAFMESEAAAESVLFYEAARALNDVDLEDEFWARAQSMVQEFVLPNSAQEINIQYKMREIIIAAVGNKKSRDKVKRVIEEALGDLNQVIAGSMMRFASSLEYLLWVDEELDMAEDAATRQHDSSIPTVLVVMDSVPLLGIVTRHIETLGYLTEILTALDVLPTKLATERNYCGVLVDLDNFPSFSIVLQSIRDAECAAEKPPLPIVAMSQYDMVRVDGGVRVSMQLLVGADSRCLISASMRKPFDRVVFSRVFGATQKKKKKSGVLMRVLSKVKSFNKSMKSKQEDP